MKIVVPDWNDLRAQVWNIIIDQLRLIFVRYVQYQQMKLIYSARYERIVQDYTESGLWNDGNLRKLHHVMDKDTNKTYEYNIEKR